MPLFLIALRSSISSSAKSLSSDSCPARIFNCSALDNVSHDLSIIAPVSSSNLILPGSVIPLRRNTSLVKSSSGSLIGGS